MFSFFFDRSDGLIRKLSGYKARKPSDDRKRYASSRQTLPSRVDLRAHMTDVEDQGETNSCVANAVAGAYEYLVKRHWGEEGYDVSRLFIYYNARVIDDDDIEDEGSVIEHAIDSLCTYGACAEPYWPFDEDAVNDEPDEDAYEEAANFLIEDVSVVPTELDAWRRCLADGYPIIFGLQLYHSFDNHRRRGLVPVPTRREVSREEHGGHAMLCVGYSDRDQVFIVRNSWGSGWGDGGYCYIPYRYIINEKYNDGDTWVIRQIEALEEDDSTWGDDEESMLEEVSTVLAEMDDEDYEVLLDAMGDVPIETRIALLMLWAADADDEISDDERDAIKDYLDVLLETVGIDRKPKRVLKKARKHLYDEEILEESIVLLGTHLPQEALASLAADLILISDADELTEEEDDFIYQIVQAWQVEDLFEE